MLHTVTETSRNEHAPSQPFLLGLTAGDENSVSAECAICARLNAIEAVSTKPAERRNSSAFGHQTLPDIIPQDLPILKSNY